MSPSPFGRLPIGLALSGGTAKSVCHVGVIKALRESGLPIDYLAATSGGGIVASIMAAGTDVSIMERIAGDMSWWKLAGVKFSKLGLVTSKPIAKFIDRHLDRSEFDDLVIPLAITATDLVTGSKRIFRSGRVSKAVRASCTIPQIYLPVEIEGRHYVDGGLSEYLPVQTIKTFGQQFTIAVNLGPTADSYEAPSNILSYVLQVTNMVARQNLRQSLKVADYVIHPNIDRFGALDFGAAEELIELGYQTTLQQIPVIEHAWRRKSQLWRRLVPN